MKTSIHYLVQAKLMVKKDDNVELEFQEFSKDFFNDEPIFARIEAFNYYQSLLDVMLESKKLTYINDKQAREALESFYRVSSGEKIQLGDLEVELGDFMDAGIMIYLIVDDINLASSLDEMNLIHGIGGLYTISPETLMLGLEFESDIYRDQKFKTEDLLTDVVFCDSNQWSEGFTEDEPGTYTILKTPFDWTGMDKPYWWGEPDYKVQQSEKQTTTWKDIIQNGENAKVEFKPTLHYNFKTQSAAIGVKGIIAKSICGFLNAKGGVLFIGVKDDGQLQGLSYDFSLSDGKLHRDYFRLQFDDTLKQFLPSFIMDNITGEFITIDEVEIFIVVVHPSKSKPIFMKGQHGKEFWVRWTASTRQYEDIEELANYCLEHWGNKT